MDPCRGIHHNNYKKQKHIYTNLQKHIPKLHITIQITIKLNRPSLRGLSTPVGLLVLIKEIRC